MSGNNRQSLCEVRCDTRLACSKDIIVVRLFVHLAGLAPQLIFAPHPFNGRRPQGQDNRFNTQLSDNIIHCMMLAYQYYEILL